MKWAAYIYGQGWLRCRGEIACDETIAGMLFKAWDYPRVIIVKYPGPDAVDGVLPE